MAEKGAYSPGCVKSKFESWSEALRSIGHTPNFRDDISAADLITDINTIAETLGRPPTSIEHRDRGEYVVKHMQNTFGSWNEALEAAGYEPHCEKGISKTKLIQEIHNVVELLGRVPTDGEIDEHGQFSSKCYYRRWDGWEAAVREAGYEPVSSASGARNCNWKENPAHEWRDYGENWKDQRKKALKRDGFGCQTPGCARSQADHQVEFGTGLHIHHIRPLSSFSDNGETVDFERVNRLENLVTVCVKHHHLWERASPLRLDTR
ncbi:endonuclease [Halorubrum persicum]|uniref:Endonuclease n=2 Tax=Halorubrum persicum TaxID=1383844 RepID=A0A2G1WHR8_9EURY|nr:endonuclease [Halorubrum persicum]